MNGTDMESEDKQPDLLIYLSKKQERAGLFEFVTPNGHA